MKSTFTNPAVPLDYLLKITASSISILVLEYASSIRYEYRSMIPWTK